MSDPGNYEVGYGRPPKKTQFVKGQSGNPKGRPKGSRNLASILQSLGSKRVPVTEGGKTRMVTMTQAILLQLVAGAARGDRHARKEYLQMVAQNEIDYAKAGRTTVPHERDLAVLDGLLARINRKSTIQSTESETTIPSSAD